VIWTESAFERLVWKGQDYGGDRYKPPLGERLGWTATLGCKGEPNRQVTIFKVRGVSPSIAIAVKPDGQRRFLGLGPGYIVESPRHPLHRAVFAPTTSRTLTRISAAGPHAGSGPAW
jgi:hypothetical protein